MESFLICQGISKHFWKVSCFCEKIASVFRIPARYERGTPVGVAGSLYEPPLHSVYRSQKNPSLGGKFSLTLTKKQRLCRRPSVPHTPLHSPHTTTLPAATVHPTREMAPPSIHSSQTCPLAHPLPSTPRHTRKPPRRTRRTAPPRVGPTVREQAVACAPLSDPKGILAVGLDSFPDLRDPRLGAPLHASA